MVRYYTDLIKSNKQWVFAGVFADKAITGTKTDKREEFQLLIQECLSGNIDLVIAKSIPRFARNTLDTLKYVRMLRERNIAVYFEVEKINTLKDGEFLLTILSSVAQQEVENTSAYVKKGLKMKMKRGELVGFQGCLGYDYDVVTKSLSINEEGAETVRYMLRRTYLKEHRPAKYSLYMLEDRMIEHVNMVDDEAQDRMETLVGHFDPAVIRIHVEPQRLIEIEE